MLRSPLAAAHLGTVRITFIESRAMGVLSLLFTLTLASSLAAKEATTVSTAPSRKVSLQEALHLALHEGPDSMVARQKVEIQKAILSGAGAFPTNPRIRLGTGGRFILGSGFGFDASAAVLQKLPLFGRWGARTTSASAAVREAEAILWSDQSRIARSVAFAYVAAQRLRGRVDVADKRVKLLRDILATAQRRLEAGDSTLLDVNLWEIEHGQAQARRAQINASYMIARVNLALLAGFDPAEPPEPSESLAFDSLADWAQTAGERADIVAQTKAIEAAKKRTELQEARAWPDVTVGATAGTEGAYWRNGPTGDLIAGARLIIPIPLFSRNQMAVAKAKASTELERAELTRTTLVARAEVAAATARVEAATDAAKTLKTLVVDKQAASLVLLNKAYDAGKLGVTDVLLRQRSMLDAEAAYVDAIGSVASARVQLAFATGALSSRVRTLLDQAPAGSEVAQ